jgi:hypothetical protein
MSSSSLHTGGGHNVSDNESMFDLTPPRLSGDDVSGIDLSDLGFHGFVSEAALAEIQCNESRASLVVTTAAKFAFR